MPIFGDNPLARCEAVLNRKSPLMPEAVYRMLTLLCGLVIALPVGTNLGVLHLLWMRVNGRLLACCWLKVKLSASGCATGITCGRQLAAAPCHAPMVGDTTVVQGRSNTASITTMRCSSKFHVTLRTIAA